jgi:hypothetical protein
MEAKIFLSFYCTWGCLGLIFSIITILVCFSWFPNFFKKITYLCDSCAEHVRYKIYVVTITILLRVLLTLEGWGDFPRLSGTCFLYKLLSINNRHNIQISQQYIIKFTLIVEYFPAVSSYLHEAFWIRNEMGSVHVTYNIVTHSHTHCHSYTVLNNIRILSVA